jgi:hypothetical protein
MKKLLMISIPLIIVMLLSVGCTQGSPEVSFPTPNPAITAPSPTSAPELAPAAPSLPQKPSLVAPSPAQAVTTSAISPGTGMVEVYVTDPPPPDMDEIWVDIKTLEVHKTGGNWTSINVTDAEPFDLKEIEGIQQFLASQIVETGKYTQIRLEVESVTIVVGGDNYTAKVPSDKIKLVGNFNVTDNNTTEITLDFNGEKSVLVTGKGDYIFKPVIKLLVSDKGKPTEPNEPAEPIELEAALGATGNATAELSTEQAKSPEQSAYLLTEGTEGTGDEARILIPMPADTKLGDIESVSWWVYAMSGYPPHIDITLDYNTDNVVDNEDMLTAEMSLNCVSAPKSIATLASEISYNSTWLQTFELTSGDGFGAITDNTTFWVTKMGSGDLNAPSGTLGQWKSGVVANDPENEMTTPVISENTTVVQLEIEVDNWVSQTDAYVDDIEIVIDGETYTFNF